MKIAPYTTDVKNLETTLYTENELYKSAIDCLSTRIPNQPLLKQVDKPRPPIKRTDGEKPTFWGFVGDLFTDPREYAIPVLFLSIIAFIAFLFISSLLIEENSLTTSQVVILTCCLVVLSLSTACLILYKHDIVGQYNRREMLYQQDIEEYKTKLRLYETEMKKNDAEYQSAMLRYNKAKVYFDGRITEITTRHEEAVSKLEKALSDLYAENVIFPKYRNLVAITAINEYLESGRCDKLEGADGAYNLYEMELRQNIIIGQLSNIIDNLEAIRNNQYSLYVELKRANETVEEIVSEMRDMNRDAKLRTFYDEVIALAETSPRYSFGVMM